MKLHEKIKQIRQEKKLKIADLHRRIQKIFGRKTLTYRSIQRIEAGQTDGKVSSLYQICLGLGITLKELHQETDQEPSPVEHIKKNEPQGHYLYNKSAYAQILTGPKMDFLALDLVLQPGGKTKIEKDPEGEIPFKKWIYILKGRKLTCIVNNKRYVLKKGDALSFDSRLPHYFENTSPTETRTIIIQNPRHI